MHLVEAVAVCRCSGVLYALKINSIRPASAPLLFAYHRQSSLVLPIFYQGALDSDCDMQSLQSWNYVFFILLQATGARYLHLVVCVPHLFLFFISLIIFVPAFTSFT